MKLNATNEIEDKESDDDKELNERTVMPRYYAAHVGDWTVS